MAVPTPAAPGNAFDEGADASAERQKAALTELLAQQGATGMNLLKNRGEDAGALAAAAKAQYGDAGQPVSALYQTFERDAQQRTNAHNEEQARIQAANRAYMDQMKSAIPLHRQESENYMNALRAEFEDRQREREAEQAARDAQTAAAQAAAARSSASASAKLSPFDKAMEDRNIAKSMAGLDWRDTPDTQKRPQDALEVGVSSDPLSIEEAEQLSGVSRMTSVAGPGNRYYDVERNASDFLREFFNDMANSNESWGNTIYVLNNMGDDVLGEYGVYREELDAETLRLFSAMFAPVWGIDPRGFGGR